LLALNVAGGDVRGLVEKCKELAWGKIFGLNRGCTAEYVLHCPDAVRETCGPHVAVGDVRDPKKVVWFAFDNVWREELAGGKAP